MKIFGQTRRDPQLGKNGFSTYKGFTLIELMVVLAVIAIITSFALPSYRILIEKRQVTSAAEQIGAFLSSVQSEAVKRGEVFFVDYARIDSETWCLGATSLAGGATDCDCTSPLSDSDACTVDGLLKVVNQDNLNYPDIMSSMDGNSGIYFDPVRGLIFSDSALTTYGAAELELVSEESSYALNLQITATGRVKTCSKSSGKKVPGYKVCTNDI